MIDFQAIKDMISAKQPQQTPKPASGYRDWIQQLQDKGMKIGRLSPDSGWNVDPGFNVDPGMELQPIKGPARGNMQGLLDSLMKGGGKPMPRIGGLAGQKDIMPNLGAAIGADFKKQQGEYSKAQPLGPRPAGFDLKNGQYVKRKMGGKK